MGVFTQRFFIRYRGYFRYSLNDLHSNWLTNSENSPNNEWQTFAWIPSYCAFELGKLRYVADMIWQFMKWNIRICLSSAWCQQDLQMMHFDELVGIFECHCRINLFIHSFPIYYGSSKDCHVMICFWFYVRRLNDFYSFAFEGIQFRWILLSISRQCSSNISSEIKMFLSTPKTHTRSLWILIFCSFIWINW